MDWTSLSSPVVFDPVSRVSHGVPHDGDVSWLEATMVAEMHRAPGPEDGPPSVHTVVGKRCLAVTLHLSVATLRPAPRSCVLLGFAAGDAPIGVGVCESIAASTSIHFILAGSPASFRALGRLRKASLETSTVVCIVYVVCCVCVVYCVVSEVFATSRINVGLALQRK